MRIAVAAKHDDLARGKQRVITLVEANYWNLALCPFYCLVVRQSHTSYKFLSVPAVQIPTNQTKQLSRSVYLPSSVSMITIAEIGWSRIGTEVTEIRPLLQSMPRY